MRRIIGIVLCCLPALPCLAEPPLEGHWEGSAQVPGHPFAVVVDLAKDAKGGWVGSLTSPTLNLQGVPLADIVVGDAVSAFALKDVLGGADVGPTKFKAHVDAAGSMSGEFVQGGNTAPFALTRSGPAQVELPPQSTPLPADVAGTWIGEYKPDDLVRHVTITLTNHPGGPATAEFVIVGRKTTSLPVDRVARDGDWLRIESNAYAIVFEGPIHPAAGQIRGTFSEDSLELPLVLRRPDGAAK